MILSSPSLCRQTDEDQEWNIKIYEDDLVHYQHQDKKAWVGPVRVFAVKGNDIFFFANGSVRKVPRCNMQLCEKEREFSQVLWTKLWGKYK